jgi:protein associated with RNAse G/E
LLSKPVTCSYVFSGNFYRLLYTARVSGIDFGLDVKTLTGKNIITEIDNFVNKTLRVKFPKEVKNILNERKFVIFDIISNICLS